MVIKCCLPLSIVERNGFREFVHYLDPSFQIPTRFKLKATEFKKLRDRVDNKNRSILESIEHPNISTDGWTDGSLRSFNGYVAQGIDHNWVMQTIPIDFVNVKGIL